MRLIIGIVLGILIVFNWSTIKGYFDSSLSGQQQKAAAPEAASPATAPKAPELPQPKDVGGAVEQRLKDIASGKAQ